MVSRAIPYEGNEPYIFLSYCHKDAEQVYPLLEQMVRDGYRIWYDDGNHPGDDWLENIAKHLNGCTVCLAMISKQSANSHNCKSEISEAIAWKKKLAAVLLETFKMSLGMQLQLSTIHYIKMPEYPSQNMLLQKLYETEGFSVCQAAPGSLPMRTNTFAESAQMPVARSENDAIADFISAADARIGTVHMPAKPATLPVKEKLHIESDSSVSLLKKTNAVIIPSTSSTQSKLPVAQCGETDDDDVATVFDDPDACPVMDGDDETPTIMVKPEQNAILVRITTGKAYTIDSDLARIGRSAKRCEIVVADNSYIGNCHAEIARYEGKYVLRDMGSANGTYVNGAKLTSDDNVLLQNESVFILYNEAFVLYTGSLAKRIISDGGLYYLRNINSHGIKLVLETPLLLDRGHKWADGTLDDAKVSRSGKHAKIVVGENGLCLEDKCSTNGTRLNGRNIKAMPPQPIKVGDEIKIGDAILEVGIITL